MIKYPNYVGRKGSKCYFTYDFDFFNKHKVKCLELISFHTLFFGWSKRRKYTGLFKNSLHFKSKKFRRLHEKII